MFNDDGSSDLDKNQYFYATFQLRDNKLKMNIEHDTYSSLKLQNLDKIRIFVKIGAGQQSQFNVIINKSTLLDRNKITFEENQIILRGLNLRMDTPFEIEWFSDGYNTLAYKFPLVDCSIQNSSITEPDCRAKGCEWNDTNRDSTPPCFINPTKGGYILSSALNKEDFTLSKKDVDFKLFDEDIPKLRVQVKHADIRNTNKKVTRIMVFLFIYF